MAQRAGRLRGRPRLSSQSARGQSPRASEEKRTCPPATSRRPDPRRGTFGRRDHEVPAKDVKRFESTFLREKCCVSAGTPTSGCDVRLAGRCVGAARAGPGTPSCPRPPHAARPVCLRRVRPSAALCAACGCPSRASGMPRAVSGTWCDVCDCELKLRPLVCGVRVVAQFPGRPSPARVSTRL